MNPFDVLGLPPTATLEEVRRAYRALAKQHHPDVCKDPAAEDRMKQINAAYEMLTKEPIPDPMPVMQQRFIIIVRPVQSQYYNSSTGYYTSF